MFTFYWPWLGLLAFLPVLIRLIFPECKIKAEDNIPQIRFPALQKISNVFPSYNSNTQKHNLWFVTLISLIWLALVIAVMRPQMVDKFTYVKNKGYDLMLAVDISGSMKALDFSTNDKIVSRLDVTKQVVSNFVKERQGDRVGLILFGEQAYLNVPLTLDTLSVSEMLNNSVSGMAGDATSIGDAIGTAVTNLRNQNKGSRVIILLTDGEDTASSIPPIEAAKIAKQYGIRIYTIGVGKNGLVPYPNGMGGVSMVQMSMDETLLEKIANITNGKYFRATNKDALSSIYAEINKLEKTESKSKEYMVREPLYRYPLGVATGLLLILVMFNLYRRSRYGF